MAFLTFRPLPPKGHCHHHRPVISFKELLSTNRELSVVSSALTAIPNAIPRPTLPRVLNSSKLLTAYCLLLTVSLETVQFPNFQVTQIAKHCDIADDLRTLAQQRVN